jgi:hypothetical protein
MLPGCGSDNHGRTAAFAKDTRRRSMGTALLLETQWARKQAAIVLLLSGLFLL